MYTAIFLSNKFMFLHCLPSLPSVQELRCPESTSITMLRRGEWKKEVNVKRKSRTKWGEKNEWAPLTRKPEGQWGRWEKLRFLWNVSLKLLFWATKWEIPHSSFTVYVCVCVCGSCGNGKSGARRPETLHWHHHHHIRLKHSGKIRDWKTDTYISISQSGTFYYFSPDEITKYSCSSMASIFTWTSMWYNYQRWWYKVLIIERVVFHLITGITLLSFHMYTSVFLLHLQNLENSSQQLKRQGGAGDMPTLWLMLSTIYQSTYKQVNGAEIFAL